MTPSYDSRTAWGGTSRRQSPGESGALLCSSCKRPQGQRWGSWEGWGQGVTRDISLTSRSLPLRPEKFSQHLVSYEDLAQNPDLLDDPSLVVKINKQWVLGLGRWVAPYSTALTPHLSLQTL